MSDLKQEDINNYEQTFQERDQKFLDFEKPVQEVSEKISALKLADTGNPAIKSQIESLKKDREQLIKKIYSKLTTWRQFRSQDTLKDLIL